MKKYVVLILSLILLLSFCFAGCGQTVTAPDGGNGSGNNPGNTDNPSGPSQTEMPEDAYTVTLELPEEVQSRGGDVIDYSSIKAEWVNSTSVYSAEFNKDGLAYYSGLDGEYYVVISGDIVGEKYSYTYNPNIYEANGTESGRNVKIQLIRLLKFSGGDGSSHYDGVRAMAYYAGAYRLKFAERGQSFTFEFNPKLTTTGYVYSLETFASVIDNEIDPTLTVLLSSTRTPTEVITGGSEYCGSFTTNVKIDMTHSTVTSGGSSAYLYQFDIDTTDDVFPKYVDIYIQQVKEYTNDDFWEQYIYKDAELEDYNTNWKEEYYDGEDPTGEFKFLSQLLGSSKDFTNLGETKFEDGFYYIEYEGEWHMVFMEIKTCHYGSIYNFLDGALGSLCQSTRYKYDAVLRSYLTTATAQGYHPVTAQLHKFLYDFSVRKMFFDSQLGFYNVTENGTVSYENAILEAMGYKSNDKNQWLFACGIYL